MDVDFKSEYLTGHLITYIGNKRKLLKFINDAVIDIKGVLGKGELSMFDGFSGSGSVARLFKHHASELYVNDLEAYSQTINQCYLANKSEVNTGLDELISYLNNHKLDPPQQIGFIERHYAPVDDNAVKPGERVFYTNRNAKIIDNLRRIMEQIDKDILPFVLAPLLIKASVHNNTSGVFKGFHKKDGLGHFGGAGGHALTRIKGEIFLEHPIFCPRECQTQVIKNDISVVVDQLPELDLVYYDPPYNQHPYGSNYFMLNIINDYNAPEIQDGVSGITKVWNKSLYNKRQEAEGALDSLIARTKAKYIMISYNNEGTIAVERFKEILERHGTVELKEQSYNTYRGSKNLGRNKLLNSGQVRALQVQELLWILKK